METHYEYDDKNPHRHSEVEEPKYLKQNLNSMNSFIFLLVISYVGSGFKLLWLSWYESMKPCRMNLELVIKTYLCCLHFSFPGVDSSSNDVMLSRMSKYLFSLEYNQFEFLYIHLFLKQYVHS